MKLYGYARVSSHDQNLDRQIYALLEKGIEKKNIFCDKESGKDFNRKNYQKLLRILKKDDVLIISSLDRLGRNYDAIIKEWKYITHTLEVNIIVLDMPLLDTAKTGRDLTGKFISDIFLELLSFVAENERNNIKKRQKEGIKMAKLKGVQFGRPKKTYTKEEKEIFITLIKHEITLKEALKLLHMRRSNFYYHLRQLKKRKLI